MPRRKFTDPGNVFEIILKNGCYSYGIIIDFPLTAYTCVFDMCQAQNLDKIQDVIDFKIWTMKSAFSRKGWKCVGHVELRDDMLIRPVFYKYNVISREYGHYLGNGVSKPAELSECIGLECAAVWDPTHIEGRIMDSYNGIENKWVKSLKPENRT